MAGVKVKPADAYVVAAEPVVLVDPTTGAPYAASGGGGGGNTTTTATAAAPTYVEGSTTNPLSVNLSGDLRVIAKQSGTWNIGTVTSITNPVAVTGTFWQATQPISAASLPLPTGAATVASQGAISDAAWSGTGDGSQIAIAKATYGLLDTPLTELAKTPLMGASDLAYVFNSSSASTTRNLVTATAAQTTRGYLMQVTAAAATTLNFTDGAGGSTLFTLEFPAAGAYALDLMSRPYFETSANTALDVISSAAVKTTVALFYVKSA